MEKPDNGDPKAKAKADREKFESIEKVETHPVIIKGSRGKGRKLDVPKLKSPDEQNPKWVTDPEEAIAARRALAREAKRSDKEA
jgi:hypothetical protein